MPSEPNSILVTGGAGFVGSWLVRDLLDKTSARVTVLDNLRNGKQEYLPADDRIGLAKIDITDAAAVRAAVAEVAPDWVFHLAALHFIPYCNAHPEETMAVNVVGTQNVLEACRACPPARLVIASTAAVYPIRDGANSEDDPAGPTDVYGLSKWVNEQQLRLYSAQCPATLCVAARLFNVYGPHETNPHVIPEILDQMTRGRYDLALGNVKPKRDYVYVTDVAAGLVSAAARTESSFRVYNVGTGAEYSVEEIVAGLAAVSGCDLRIVADPKRVRPADRMHLLCDNGRLRRETGWAPRQTLPTGLADLWDWTRRAAAVPTAVR